jgi:hypothetical protein
MNRFFKIFLLLILGLMIFSVLMVGIFTIFPAVIFLTFIFLYACLVFFKRVTFSGAVQLAVLLSSTCLFLTCLDLTIRLINYEIQKPRAHPIVKRDYTFPALKRFLPNRLYQGTYYGDLAALLGDRELREPRPFRFQTDAYGFRNDPANKAGDCDLIILGDSFGAGSGTSQEDIMASHFTRQYGLKVYNMSIAGTSPWDEYVNLAYEVPHLNFRKGTALLWLIFPGNDLDEEYGEVDISKLRRNNFFEAFYTPIRSFKDHSPIRRMIAGGPPNPQDFVIKKNLPDGRPILFVELYIKNRLRNLKEIQESSNYGKFKMAFEAMRKLSAQQGLRHFVVQVPSKEEVYEWILNGTSIIQPIEHQVGFSMALSQLCQERGVPFLDLYPFLKEEADKNYIQSKTLLWWRDDSHWNRLGQEIATSTIVQHLSIKEK